METNYTKKLVKLKLKNIGSEGDTTAYYNEEQINIFGGIPGETVIAEIDIQKKTRTNKEILSICIYYKKWKNTASVDR